MIMKTRLTLLLILLVALCACRGRDASPSAENATEPTAKAAAAKPTELPVDLYPLILAAARVRHPQFDGAFQARSVSEVDEMIQAKAGFEPLPSIRNEMDPALRRLYAEAATLYQLDEVIAAQALLRTVPTLSAAGIQLQRLVDDAYTPVGDPESLEVQGEEGGAQIAQDLQDYAQRAATGEEALRRARLVGQQRVLAELRVKAGVYHDTNGVAIDAAEAALKASGNDPRTRRAIDKALHDAAR